MKTIAKIFGCLVLLLPVTTRAFEVHVNGPSYTCPNSELLYTYSDDYGGGDVELTVTKGEVFNEITQTWVTYLFFYEGDYSFGQPGFPFKIRWANYPNGTVGNVHIRICAHNTIICSNGDRDVTFGASPGTPTLSGSAYILNCQDQQQNYTATNLPENWQLVNWNYSSHIQQVGTGLNPVVVKATSTTSNTLATLTGVFNFTTGGNTCATKNVYKSIWLGKPGAASQTVDGFPYSSGSAYPICPGSHSAQVVTWNGGPVSSTSWTVPSGISYSAYNNTCDFVMPGSGYLRITITVKATNACGTGNNASFILPLKNSGCGSFMALISPNPADSELTIQTSLINEKESTQYAVVADEVILVDNVNSRLITKIPTESTIKLDTRNIPKGEYFLHIKFGEKDEMRRIIISK